MRPDEINSKINSFTNNSLPHFFKYAKDKKEYQVVPANLSFVNKLEDIIINPRMNFKKFGLGEIDYRLLMHNPDIDVNMSFAKNGRIVEEETDPIIVEYSKFERKHYLAIDQAVNSSKNNKSEAYIRAQAKLSNIADEFKNAMSRFGKDDYEITDILVKYLYGTNKKNKTALWLCYGDIIYENLSGRIKKKTKEVQCVDCGEWFEVSVFDSATCRCKDCAEEHKRELARIRKQNQRKKNKMSRDPLI